MRIPLSSPKLELLINFLEINEKNLREFYLREDIKSPNLVTKLCPNLRNLSINLESNESETLKTVFNDCQYLESLRIWYDSRLMNEKEMLENGCKVFIMNLTLLL